MNNECNRLKNIKCPEIIFVKGPCLPLDNTMEPTHLPENKQGSEARHVFFLHRMNCAARYPKS